MELDSVSNSSNVEIIESNKVPNDLEFVSACNLIQTILAGSEIDSSLNAQSSEDVCPENIVYMKRESS
ncbi:hypothetical protein Anas_06585 [Armadillidium nasatum]|uniref:Uncharacterized protein n=1 Tax=Armadillidium nasatum TaxID=96803 RepID=A0A5N5T1I4_9CRUS|nr:hypothetical protein Anas_06585 [Armadillidium nasatum]